MGRAHVVLTKRLPQDNLLTLSIAEGAKRERGRFDPSRMLPPGGTPTAVDAKSDDFLDGVLLPEQFFSGVERSVALWSGERRLLFAVLQDAVACWFHSRHAQSARGRRLFRETQDWFWAKDRSWLCAFERICEHLDLDPDYIRRELTRWQTLRPNRQAPTTRAQPVLRPQHLSLVRG